MKITEFTCTPVHTRRQTGLVSQHVIVEIHTDGELVGIGEISDLNHEPLYMPDVDDLARTLTTLFGGQDVLDTAALEILLARSYPGNLLNGGISMAFYDIAGKALGVPVYTFFGGKYRDRIKMCYPLFRMHAPEDVEDRLETVRDLLNEGYDLFRLYVGGNLDLDMAFLEQFSAEFGGRARIKSLDFSGLLTWKESVSAIERFERFDFDMVESPSWGRNARGLAEVRKRISKPVSEHAESFAHAREYIEREAVDIFNICIDSLGGLRDVQAVYQLARIYGIKTLSGTTQELSIGTSAQGQVVAAMPNLDYPSDFAGGRLYLDDVVVERVRYENGSLVVPDGPGLGMTLDPEKLRALSRPLVAIAETVEIP